MSPTAICLIIAFILLIIEGLGGSPLLSRVSLRPLAYAALVLAVLLGQRVGL